MEFFAEASPEIKAIYDESRIDTEEAKKKATALIKQAEQKGDGSLSAKGTRALSAVQLRSGDFRTAATLANNALLMFDKLGDVAGQVSAQQAVVDVNLAEQNFEEAKRSTSNLAKKFQNSGSAYGEASMNLLQGEIYSASREFDTATTEAKAAYEVFEKMSAAQKDAPVAFMLLKLAELYASLQMPAEAMKTAGEASAIFGKVGEKKGEAAAAHAMARVSYADGKMDEAIAKTDEALATLQNLEGTSGARETALRTKIEVLVANEQKPQARNAAKEAVALARAAGDLRGEAVAQLLVAEVCGQTLQYVEAVAAAKRAGSLFKQLQSNLGQVAAYTAIAAADYDNEMGEGVMATEERITLCKGFGDLYQEAEAHLTLANMYVTILGRKLGKCSLACADDSLAALKAASYAHDLFDSVGWMEGKVQTMRIVSAVLMYNKVPQDLVLAVGMGGTPDKVLADVMEGRYSSSKNALPGQEISKNLKLEEVVPSVKQLDKTSFAWNKPLQGFSYTLVWQPVDDRAPGKRKPPQKYDILTVAQGSSRLVAPITQLARSCTASEREKPLVLYMVSPEAKYTYASTIMSIMHTVGAMIIARVQKITFVQMDESHFDWSDKRARQCHIHSCVLGLLRSIRLEAPHIQVGYVGGDCASWLTNPGPMIDSIFDTLESDESEVSYKRGDAFAPLLVHRALEDSTMFVKPRKKKGAFF